MEPAIENRPHPLRLLWSPLALPRIAATATRRDCLWGGAAMLGCGWWFFLHFLVLLGEPWGNWETVLEAFLVMSVFAPIVGSPILLPPVLVWTLIWWEASRAPKPAGVHALLLSPLSLLVPAVIWTICFFLPDLNDHVVADRSLDWFVHSLPIHILCSGWWLPTLLVAWLGIVLWAWPRAAGLARQLQHDCPTCGYDLSGSLGNAACPECGAGITRDATCPSPPALGGQSPDAPTSLQSLSLRSEPDP